MITQYTAAALVNELQTLAHPSSVDSIPTSANQEDHVSMGATGALHLREVVDRTEAVLAIEALCAAQGLDFRSPMRPGAGVAQAHARVRGRVPHLAADRPPAPDIETVRELLRSGALADLMSGPDALTFALVDAESFDAIPAPARAGARCQTCDYWERLDGTREASEARAAREPEAVTAAGGYAPGRRLRPARLPDRCRRRTGRRRLGAVRADLRLSARPGHPRPIPRAPRLAGAVGHHLPPGPRRGRGSGGGRIGPAVGDLRGARPARDHRRRGLSRGPARSVGPVRRDRSRSTWTAASSAWPATIDTRCMRRELGESGEVGWGDLLSRTAPPDEGEGWPLPLPTGPSEDDLFRLPEKPKRPNPFGDD